MADTICILGFPERKRRLLQGRLFELSYKVLTTPGRKPPSDPFLPPLTLVSLNLLGVLVAGGQSQVGYSRQLQWDTGYEKHNQREDAEGWGHPRAELFFPVAIRLQGPGWAPQKEGPWYKDGEGFHTTHPGQRSPRYALDTSQLPYR